MSKSAGLYVNLSRDPDDRDTWHATVRVRMDRDGAGFTVRGVDDEPEAALERASDRASDVMDAEPSTSLHAPHGARDALAAIKLVCHAVRNGGGRALREGTKLEPEWDELVRKLEGCREGSGSIGGPLCLCHHADDERALSSGAWSDVFGFIGNALHAANDAIQQNPALAAAAGLVPGGSTAVAALKAANDAQNAGAKKDDTKKALEKHLADHPEGKKIAKDAVDKAGKSDGGDAAALLALALPFMVLGTDNPLAPGDAEHGPPWGGWGSYDQALSPEGTDRYWHDWLAEQMRAFRDESQQDLYADDGGARGKRKHRRTRRYRDALDELAGAGRTPLRMPGTSSTPTATITLDPTGGAPQVQLTPYGMPPPPLQQPPSPYGSPPYGSPYSDPSQAWGAWGGPQYGPFAPPPPDPYAYGYGSPSGWGMPAPYGYGYAPMMGQGGADASDTQWAYDVQSEMQPDFSSPEFQQQEFREEWQGPDTQPSYGPDPYAAQMPYYQPMPVPMPMPSPYPPPPYYPPAPSPYGAPPMASPYFPPYGVPPLPYGGPSATPPTRTPHATVTQTGPVQVVKKPPH